MPRFLIGRLSGWDGDGEQEREVASEGRAAKGGRRRRGGEVFRVCPPKPARRSLPPVAPRRLGTAGRGIFRSEKS